MPRPRNVPSACSRFDGAVTELELAAELPGAAALAAADADAFAHQVRVVDGRCADGEPRAPRGREVH
jgi:hypothetical protein